MPAQPAWFHRLDEILEELRALHVSHLDRLAVQKLFRVRERRARQLMAGLPALQVGNALAVERLGLLGWLEKIQGGERFAREATRRARLAEDLERTRRLAPGRCVRVATPADAAGLEMKDLPAGIHLRPGELRIEFLSAEDLLRHLYEISQAILNDYERFQKAVEYPVEP